MDRQGSTAGLAPVANVPPCCRFSVFRQRAQTRELLVWGALKRKEHEAEPLPRPVARSGARSARPALRPVGGTSTASTMSPKRCPKPVQLALLYPESQVESQVQAKTLLQHIQAYAEDAIGKYVPQHHLQRFYGELCEREGWEPRHWSVIGEQLGRITDKKIVKRNNKRFRAYRIPRARC